jgi:hypothetical protein
MRASLLLAPKGDFAGKAPCDQLGAFSFLDRGRYDAVSWALRSVLVPKTVTLPAPVVAKIEQYRSSRQPRPSFRGVVTRALFEMFVREGMINVGCYRKEDWFDAKPKPDRRA